MNREEINRIINNFHPTNSWEKFVVQCIKLNVRDGCLNEAEFYLKEIGLI